MPAGFVGELGERGRRHLHAELAHHPAAASRRPAPSTVSCAHVVAEPAVAYGAVLPAVRDALTAAHPLAHVTVQVEPPGWETGETHL